MPQPQNGLEISGVELLQRVASFYEDAWAILLVLVIIFLTFVGVIIPIMIRWYQQRTFRIEGESLKQEIKKQVEEIRASLSTELSAEMAVKEKQRQTQLDSRMAEMKGSLDKQARGIQGGVFFVQGRANLAQRWYALGLQSFLSSAKDFVESEEEENLQSVLELIIDQVLPNLTKETINDPQLELVTDFDQLIPILEKINERGRYTNSIRKLKGAWKEANDRAPKPSGGNP